MHYFVTYKKQLKTKWGVETIFAKFEESSDGRGTLEYVFTRRYSAETTEIRRDLTLGDGVILYLKKMIEGSAIMSESEDAFPPPLLKTLEININDDWCVTCASTKSLIHCDQDVPNHFNDRAANRVLYFFVAKLESLIFALVKTHFDGLPIT
jgi:hypothetical protein